MDHRHWRNPAFTGPKKRNVAARKPKPAVEIITPKQETKNMKISLQKIKDQFREAREQLQQIESTMDTLYNVLDTMERFGKQKIGQGNKTQSNLLKSFQNIDFKQVMNLLQSPLVQALIETMAEEEEPSKSPSKKKRE